MNRCRIGNTSAVNYQTYGIFLNVGEAIVTANDLRNNAAAMGGLAAAVHANNRKIQGCSRRGVLLRLIVGGSACSKSSLSDPPPLYTPSI